MSQFHQFWTAEIKRKSKASFCAWETEKGVTRLKLIFDGKPHYLPITGDFGGVNIETYTQLLKEITE